MKAQGTGAALRHSSAYQQRAIALRAQARALRLQADAADAEAEALELTEESDAGLPSPAAVDRVGLGKALGVSVATIDRMRLAGAPVIWVCDSPRFEVAAVIAWLRERGSSK